MAGMSTVKISDDVRDSLKDLAASYGETQGDVVRRAVELLKREAFWEDVAQIEPDDDYWAEFEAWDAAGDADFADYISRFEA
jgi:predicted transcriptional regulator